MKIVNTTQKAYRYAKRTFVDIGIEVELDKWDDFDSLKSRLKLNTPWMADHLCQFGDYDYSYNISLWADSLEALGRGLLRWDNVIGSQRNGRRALTAAGMLKRAYNYESWEDKSYINWTSKNRHVNVPIQINKRKYHRVDILHEHKNAMGMDPEKYADKMWRIIHERQEKVEEGLKTDAWAYIQKYIQHLWD